MEFNSTSNTVHQTMASFDLEKVVLSLLEGLPPRARGTTIFLTLKGLVPTLRQELWVKIKNKSYPIVFEETSKTRKNGDVRLKYNL